MTMPHLMNCPHDDEGWCLSCVKAQANRLYELEGALDTLVHTQKCWDYAIRTASRGQGAYCIAECADFRRAILGGRPLGLKDIVPKLGDPDYGMTPEERVQYNQRMASEWKE